MWRKIRLICLLLLLCNGAVAAQTAEPNTKYDPEAMQATLVEIAADFCLVYSDNEDLSEAHGLEVLDSLCDGTSPRGIFLEDILASSAGYEQFREDPLVRLSDVSSKLLLAYPPFRAHSNPSAFNASRALLDMVHEYIKIGRALRGGYVYQPEPAPTS